MARPKTYIHKIVAPEEADEPPENWVEEVRQRAMLQDKYCIESTNPRVAAIALWRLAQGNSNLKVSKETGLTWATVRKLAWRHSDTLETKKKMFSSIYAKAAEAYTDLIMLKAEQLMEDPDALAALSPEKLAVTIGVMTDKAVILAGMPNTIVETRKGASLDDAANALVEIRARIANKIKSESIDV